MSETYSGSVQSGWNPNGSYDRIQFANEGHEKSLRDICSIIDEGGSQFQQSDRSRLDMRIQVQIPKSSVMLLETLYPQLEIACLYNPTNFDEVWELQIMQNNLHRAQPSSTIKRINSQVRQQIAKNTMTDVSTQVEVSIQFLQEHDMYFVTDNFSAGELYGLWGDNFGWTERECQNALSSNISGIRNNQGQLIAVSLISDGESTEWAVTPEYRGQNLMTHLLVLVYGKWAQEHVNKILYLHARHDRSVGTHLRAGGYIDPDRFLITNHVTVGRSNPNTENQKINLPALPEAEYLRHFAVGQLDPRQFTVASLEKIDTFVNNIK